MVPVELLLAAQAQIAALLEQVGALTAQLAASQAEAREERLKLQLTIEALVAKIEALAARRGKPTSPPLVVPPSAPPPELDSRPLPPAKPLAEEGVKKRRAPRARPTLPQAPLETVRPERCDRCGGTQLLAKDTTRRELVDWVAGYVQQRVVALTRCRCVDCGEVTSPAVPGACLPKTHFTAALVAHLLHGKYTLHLALERIRGELARQGYPMASATISDVVQRALHELRGVARAVSKTVQSLPYNHSDATGLPVVLDDHDRTHLGQMFFFGWGKLAAFRYSPDKEGASFKRILGPFRGTMVLDASSTHNAALEDGSVRWAGCNAHGLRKFRDAKEVDPVLAAEGERWIASWFDKDREAQEQGLHGSELLQWRQRHIAPLVKGFKAWLTLVHPTVLPRSPLAEATRYYANYWRPLTAFLRDPNLPLDNNFAERSLRGHAVGRNNWYFAGSDLAARLSAAARTLVVTAQLEGLDVLAYLTWLLERAAACREGGGLYADLTPAACKKAQERVAG